MSNQLLSSSVSQSLTFAKQRNQSLPSSTKARTTPNGSRSSSICKKRCLFCKPSSKKSSEFSLSPIINRALYEKYSASQNYHYTKHINDIMFDAKTAQVIEFHDLEHFDEEEEYLKRFYNMSEYTLKLRTLTEYYKFHKDVSRMFMRPATDVLNRYHDKKRRLEYIRITKMLQEEEEQNKSRSRQETPKSEGPKDVPIIDRVLDDLDKSNFETKYSDAHMYRNSEEFGTPNRTGKFHMKGTQSIYVSESVKSELLNKYLRDPMLQKATPKNDENMLKKSNDISISNTIHELNLKLGEIINNSHSRVINLDVPNFLETCEQKQDPILSGLVDNVRKKQKAKNQINIVNIDLIKPVQTSAKQTLCTSPANHKTSEHHTDEGPHTKAGKARTHTKRKDLEDNLAKTSTALRNSYRKVTNQENKDAQEDDTSLVMLSTERAVARKSSLVKPRKKTPSVAKIRGFDEVFAIQQGGGQSKANSQRSLSGEKIRKKSKLNSSRKNLDERMRLKDETPTLTRRESRLNSKDLSKSNAEIGKKDKSITSNKSGVAKVKHIEPQDLKAKKSGRATSHKKMRISVDVNSSGKHPIQQISFHNFSNLTGTGKALSLATQSKGFSRNLNNFNTKMATEKALTSRTARKYDPETKTLLLESTLKKDNTKRSKLQSRLSSRERSNSVNKSKDSEDGIVSMKKSAEKFYGKMTERTSKNALKTKSEESQNKEKSTERTKDLSKMKKPSNLQALKSEEDKTLLEDEEKLDKKHVYTYNNSNVVNIFVHPGDKISMEDPLLIISKNILNSERRPKSRHPRDNEFPTEGKKSNLNYAEKSQNDEYKGERSSKSPLRSSRKSKPKLSKSKSGTLEHLARTTSKEHKSRETYL